MILVDTSVWIAHLRSRNEALATVLVEGQTLTHPFIIGEIACGALRNRAQVIEDLRALPSAKVVTDGEAMALVENRRLWGKGIGWIDAHLLASSIISNCALWTQDRALRRAAVELGLAGP